MNSLSSSTISLKFLPFSPAAFPQDQICSIVGDWLLLSRWLFFLLILQIVAYHDFPRNWLLSISPYPSEQLGNEMWQFWDLRKTVLFRLSPFHPQGLWKLGCLKQPRFPPWLTVPKAPCQGAPSHDPPAQGMIPWRSTRQFSRVPSFHATAAVAVLFLPRSRDWVCPEQLH